MGLLTIVLLAWVIARIAAVDIPIPVSTAMVSATVAIVIFLFALIKNLADDYSTFWSYLGVVLAAAIAVGAWLEVQEAGGVETLKSDVQGMRPPRQEPELRPPRRRRRASLPHRRRRPRRLRRPSRARPARSTAALERPVELADTSRGGARRPTSVP